MKKLMLLIFPLIFLLGCTQKAPINQSPTQDVKQKELIFSRNQDCLKMKGSIEKKLQEKEASLGKASLEQIFYSPKANSCLYVEYTEMEMPYFNRRLFDVLDDGPSSHPIDACMGATLIRGDIDCADFNKKLEDYKAL